MVGEIAGQFGIGTELTAYLAGHNFPLAPVVVPCQLAGQALAYTTHDRYSPSLRGDVSLTNLMFRAEIPSPAMKSLQSLHWASEMAYRAGTEFNSAEGYLLYADLHSRIRKLTTDKRSASEAALRMVWGCTMAYELSGNIKNLTPLIGVLLKGDLYDLSIRGAAEFVANAFGETFYSIRDSVKNGIIKDKGRIDDVRCLESFLFSSMLSSLVCRPECPEGATLSDFLLGDLDPLDALSVSAHVVSCRKCFALVGAMKECMEAVKESKEPS
jgi:hypothetical protein